MKAKQFIISSCVLALLVTGCTSIYFKKDFSTEEAFYKQINENSGSAGLIMANDSTIDLYEPRIEQDSVKWETTNYKFLFDPNSRSIVKHSIPLNDIKAVTFTHHWGGNILTGIYSGILTGGVLGAALLQLDIGGGNSGSELSPLVSAVPGAVAGILLGGIVGIITGEDDLFIFDDSPSGLKLIERNSRHQFGLKLGRNSGFSNDLILQKYHNSDFTKLRSNRMPGPIAALYYNYPFSQLFSLNSELSFASIGSSTKLAVWIPNMKKADPGWRLNSYESSSEEYMKVLEMAAVARLNLFRSNLTPYILLGPRFGILFPGESGINKFLTGLQSRVNTQGIGLSSEYNRLTFGTTFGGGFSTGKLLPVELLVEARYNFDFTPRFVIHYNIPGDVKFLSPYYNDPGNQLIKYRSSEFQLTIGAAIF
ncbi:MAG: hypothetical protein ACM3P0_16345 [Acidobacteriota bacterium]